jgi:RNA 2',3'-cyclic 3'-phosphodiesterase
MFKPATSHRLFFALRPPLVLARQIVHSGLWGGAEDKALRADQLHMTIDILDDFPSFPERVAEMLCDAAETVSADPVAIALDQRVAGHRSVALRPRRRLREFTALYERIEAARRRAGLAQRHGYRMNPHMTLGYVDGRHEVRAIDPIAWLADEFVLIHSLVGRSEHRVLGRWALRGAHTPQYSLFETIGARA